MAGDFNNRTRHEDRTGSLPREHPETGEEECDGPQALAPPQPPLLDKEGQLNCCLESRGMEDAGLAVPVAILCHPTHTVENYKANHAREHATQGFTFYHPRGASQINRVYAQWRKWGTESCQVMLTTWSDHGIFCTCLRSIPPPLPPLYASGEEEERVGASGGGPQLHKGWRLHNELLCQQHYYERLEYLIMVQWIQMGS